MIAERKAGSIIMVASMSGGIVNYPQEQSCYNASKAGVIQLGKSLAAEWAKHDIRVNCISPGLWKEINPPQKLHWYFMCDQVIWIQLSTKFQHSMRRKRSGRVWLPSAAWEQSPILTVSLFSWPPIHLLLWPDRMLSLMGATLYIRIGYIFLWKDMGKHR